MVGGCVGRWAGGLWTTEAGEEGQNPRQSSQARGSLLGYGLPLRPGERLHTSQASGCGLHRRVWTLTQEKPMAGRSMPLRGIWGQAQVVGSSEARGG